MVLFEKKIKAIKLKKILTNRFLRNAGWLGSAELVNRIFRLGTTIVIARAFTEEDHGLMAIIYTTYEFATILPLKGGIGSKIVQAKAEELEAICNTAYWLNWLVCSVVFIVQCCAAFLIAWFFKDNKLILPLCTVALVYFIYPFFLVQGALIERENRLKVTATCYAVQGMISNIITAILALLGMGVWAVVWSIVLGAPVWMIILLRQQKWRPKKFSGFQHWRKILAFAKNILGIEILNKLRMNIDYLIVGKFLGIEALGLYYFAFNAGSGITMNVINSLIWPLFPHLCSVRENFKNLQKQYFKSVKTIALIVIPLVLLQSSLAPLYVPIVFSEKWVKAIPILIMICLSVIPRVFSLASNQLLNAVDKTRITLILDMSFTI
ncbi:MAG: lipopolysaccharide biosynthesis protein, partial [Cyanobacteria bacterium J083]